MTIQETQEKIINEFKIFGDWMAKYNHLIALGTNLPPIDSKYKTEENLVKGCQVKTWFHSELKDGNIFFYVESNSIVIKGVIVLLTMILSGQKPKDVQDADLYFIDAIGLREMFAPIRANSLWKIVNQMKKDAAKHEAKN